MLLSENVLEEIIFSHPECFFPERDFERYARQLHLGPRAGGSRIDIAFSDGISGELWLFEIKASNRTTLTVVDQVSRYVDDVRRLAVSKCECPFPSPPKAGVIAPSIPTTIERACARKDISCFEFSEEQFVEVAEAHRIPLVLTPARGVRLAYWSSFDKYLRAERGTLPSITPADTNHMRVASSQGIELTFRCSTEHNCVDVDLTFGTRASALFPRFCERRADIDRDLGQTVLWFKQGSERHIRVQQWADVRAEALWPQLRRWMRTQGEILLRHARSIQRGY